MPTVCLIRVLIVMNQEFQKVLLEQSYSSFDSFGKSELFRVSSYDSVYGELISFLNKNENKKIIILSKWFKNIKGMKYEALYRCLPLLQIKSFAHPFRDEDYLKPIGNIRSILLPIEYMSRIAKLFDITSKEYKRSVYSCNYLFSLYDYKKYIVQRKVKRAKEIEDNDNYFREISFDEKLYFRKEYVSEHKYASDFLKSYVEENIKNITNGEKKAKSILEEYNVEFEFQKACLVFGRSYIMDFYLPKYGVCIEIDGGYHDTPEQLVKDKERTNMLARSGVLVVRFTNEDMITGVSLRNFIKNIISR